jgi:hypothetical protein
MKKSHFRPCAKMPTLLGMGQLTTKGYVVPGCVYDKTEGATSWVNVVRKKRTDGSGQSSSLVGKQGGVRRVYNNTTLSHLLLYDCLVGIFSRVG